MSSPGRCAIYRNHNQQTTLFRLVPVAMNHDHGMCFRTAISQAITAVRLGHHLHYKTVLDPSPSQSRSPLHALFILYSVSTSSVYEIYCQSTLSINTLPVLPSSSFMLFLLALLFFSLSTSVTALPMNQPHGLKHDDHPLPIAYSITRVEVPARYSGCWAPMFVSECCSFIVTSFEPLIA